MKVQFTNDLNNTFDEIHNYSYNNILTDSETFSFVEEKRVELELLLWELHVSLGTLIRMHCSPECHPSDATKEKRLRTKVLQVNNTNASPCLHSFP